MRLLLLAWTVALTSPTVTSHPTESYTIDFWSVDGKPIKQTSVDDIVVASVRLEDDDGSRSPQARELLNVNRDGSDFVFDGCRLLNITNAAGSTESAQGFLRPFEYDENGRNSLTTSILLELQINLAPSCIVTAQANRFRWRGVDANAGQTLSNARRAFELPILPPASPPRAPPASPPLSPHGREAVVRFALRLALLLALLVWCLGLLLSRSRARGG